jgi:pimeloyl-ACP methyl ester carboxylesterase
MMKGDWDMQAIDCAYSIEGEGPALFMVHGVGGRRQGWAGLVDRLKAEYRCISYDLRGHGDSPRSPLPFGLEELVADLEALRAKLGIEKAHVIGHSLGGMVAPAYARRHPDRVLSVGLLNTAAFRTDEDRARARVVVASMEKNGIQSVLDLLVPRWFTDAFVKARPDLVAARKRQLREMDPATFINTFSIYAETEMSAWLHEVTAPALVLTGEFDPGCSPRLNRLMAERLPDARLVILDGLRHSILIEAPERLAEAVAAFLADHRPTPSAPSP